MSEKREKLLKHCMKPEEINGDADTKDKRVRELICWFVRYADGKANPKWVTEHAMNEHALFLQGKSEMLAEVIEYLKRIAE